MKLPLTKVQTALRVRNSLAPLIPVYLSVRLDASLIKLIGLKSRPMGWQEAYDGLAWLGESARGVFAYMLGTQCEEDREESAPGHSHFAWEV